MKNIILLSMFLFILNCSSQLVLKQPTEIPNPSTDIEKNLINEGISFHDEGKYDLAIQKYNAVLKANSSNVLAMYELSYTYLVIKDYQKSLDIALRASQYKSDYLGPIYLQIGTNLDYLGKPKDAISTYKRGIDILPDSHLLHYNLGVTYIGMNQPDKARESFKKAVQINPEHASSHVGLGEIYYNKSYRVPTVLAYCRFLILEPKSQRSVTAFNNIQDMLGLGVESQNENNTEINIFVQPNPPTEDGEFTSVDLGLSMRRAVRFTDEYKDKSQMELFIGDFESLFQIMYELTENDEYSGFVWEYYAPYFMELKQKGFTETFVNYIFQITDITDVHNWLKDNQLKVKEFLKWSEEYQFQSR